MRTGVRAAAATAVALLVVAGLAIVSPRANAQGSCKKVSANFTIVAVTGAACTSSVGVCAVRSYKGGALWSSTFTVSSSAPTLDTPSTGVVLLTADELVHGDGGTLLIKNAVLVATRDANRFSELGTIVGGTGEWVHATGQLTASGTFDPATGGEGTISGELCVP